MPAMKLDRTEWRPFFDGVSKALEGTRAQIEVASIEIGDQSQTRWLPLLGVVYDHKDDLVEVIVEGLDHLIYKPRDVYVDVGVGGLASIEIIDRDDTRQLVRIKDPLMLPPPV